MFRYRTAQADVVVVPRTDLEQLNEELARLRLEGHRTLNLAEVGRSARAIAEAAVDSDEAWHAVTEAQALRASLLGTLRDLQIAAGQLERQLGTATPAAEVDRRVAPERRRLDVATQRHPDHAVAWAARSLPARPPVPVLAGLMIDASGKSGIALVPARTLSQLRMFPVPVPDLESDNDMVVLP